MVSTYLGTKSIGAGTMIVAALAMALYGSQSSSQSEIHALLGPGVPVIGGLFIAITLALLVADLKRPERALFLITKANPTSWLVWGGYILGILGLIEVVWFGAALFGFFAVLRFLLLPAALIGAAAAGYTAFLFGQAEGRDFWQSPLLLPVLLTQAILAGAATLGVLASSLGIEQTLTTFLSIVMLCALAVHILLILLEVLGSHSNSHIAAAAHVITKGQLRLIFWGLFLVFGSLLPGLLLALVLLLPGTPPLFLALAGLAALVGLFTYEHCFVVAGQAVPLS
jgi:formate-dependent nitrite reductase membrane component NrfD